MEGGICQSIDTAHQRHYKHSMKRILFMLLAGLLTLTACNLPELTPPPPTETPTLTATVTLTPTLTPIPPPTSTPTPVPALLIAKGQKALANGDYPTAKDSYQLAFDSSSTSNAQAEALWGLGKTHFLNENDAGALEALRTLAHDYPDANQAAWAYLLLGETYYDLDRYQESAEAYGRYLQLRPGLLDAYVQEMRGDALYSAAQFTEAASAYQSALTADGQLDPASIRIKIANSYLSSGQPNEALSIYDEIYAATHNDYIKAQILLLSGRALLLLNRTSDAYDRWQFSIANYPLSYDAYSALVALLDAGQPVNDFDRGLVDYYARQYDVARIALERYIANNPDHDGSALYYNGLVLRELGEYKQAIAAWDKFIANYPNNQHWASAWDERATVYWVYLDQYTVAAQSLVDYVRKAPDSPVVVDYLIEAARIYERANKLEESVSIWESLPRQYPASADTFGNALFQAGIIRYRQEKFPQALEDFKLALKLAANAADNARAQLWIGKTYQASGDSTNAKLAWQNAQLADSTGYYSVRARDLLDLRQPFATAPASNINYDLAAERRTAMDWLRVKFNMTSDIDLNGLGALASDPRFQRGVEFWQVGMYEQARAEFEVVRESVRHDPVDSFRLGNYLLDLGCYRPAIFAIRQVLTLAGLDDHADSLNAPPYFKHVRYGLYYDDIVWPASTENEVDPLFTTSLIRQESLFEGFVRSNAGARGLMQIIPPTGESIATTMGWPPNYKDDDLYSPYVSIRMGTFYLKANLRLLNGDIYAALAAYNGGPGNAQAWQSIAKGDPDLMLEVIRFSETRNYIRGIYETYTIYRSIYSPLQ